MKRILAIAALAFSVQLCNAMSKITLPDAPTLTQRLNDAGFEELVMHTSIINRLAGKEVTAATVSLAIEIYLCNYAKSTHAYKNLYKGPLSHEPIALTTELWANQSKLLAYIMRRRKQELTKAILQDHPTVIEELKTTLPK